jgi:pimeloyl-ACP methyl ester carboxylesterase
MHDRKAEMADHLTYVLVHGAWYGGWCWRDVSNGLTALGGRVFTPTLTGLGERSHLLRPDIDLSLHIRDVVNVIEYEDLSDFILCGHSYGGMVISGVAEVVTERIRAIVYLDALKPTPGACVWDYMTDTRRRALDASTVDNSMAPRPPTGDIPTGGNSRWIGTRCRPHPRDTFMERLPATSHRDSIGRKIYVRATGFDQPIFQNFADEASTQGWERFDVNCGHDLMIEASDEVVAILYAAAQ